MLLTVHRYPVNVTAALPHTSSKQENPKIPYAKTASFVIITVSARQKERLGEQTAGLLRAAIEAKKKYVRR